MSRYSYVCDTCGEEKALSHQPTSPRCGSCSRRLAARIAEAKGLNEMVRRAQSLMSAIQDRVYHVRFVRDDGLVRDMDRLQADFERLVEQMMVAQLEAVEKHTPQREAFLAQRAREASAVVGGGRVWAATA